MAKYECHFVHLKCTFDDCANVFRVQLEYKDDIRATAYDEDGTPNLNGFAIFRDNFFVQCPKCFRRRCRLIPGLATVEIDKRR